jgi:TP901-1 family phage major tail protein
MTAYNSDQLLLKISNGGTPEVFAPIGGLRGTELSINAQAINATHKMSESWQELLNVAGTKSVRIKASGRLTDSAAEAQIRQLAFTDSLHRYQLAFSNGDTLQGSFKITQYNRSGEYFDVENYTLMLESSGIITFASV